MGGEGQMLLSALSAIVSSAPSLTCLRFNIREWLPSMEVPPISSASLESFTVDSDPETTEEVPPAPLVLTFLPACTRLCEVCVRSSGEPPEGTAVKIRYHCCSPRCIVPLDVQARQAEALRLPEPAE